MAQQEFLGPGLGPSRSDSPRDEFLADQAGLTRPASDPPGVGPLPSGRSSFPSRAFEVGTSLIGLPGLGQRVDRAIAAGPREEREDEIARRQRQSSERDQGRQQLVDAMKWAKTTGRPVGPKEIATQFPQAAALMGQNAWLGFEPTQTGLRVTRLDGTSQEIADGDLAQLIADVEKDKGTVVGKEILGRAGQVLGAGIPDPVNIPAGTSTRVFNRQPGGGLGSTDIAGPEKTFAPAVLTDTSIATRQGEVTTPLSKKNQERQDAKQRLKNKGKGKSGSNIETKRDKDFLSDLKSILGPEAASPFFGGAFIPALAAMGSQLWREAGFKADARQAVLNRVGLVFKEILNTKHSDLRNFLVENQGVFGRELEALNKGQNITSAALRKGTTQAVKKTKSSSSDPERGGGTRTNRVTDFLKNFF